MAAYQINKVNIKNLSGGIDQHGSPNNLEETYVEDLINIDADPQGQLSCRKGYESFCGYIPLRIFRLIEINNSQILEADRSLDFTYMTNTMTTVYGTLGDLDTAASAINHPPNWYLQAKPATQNSIAAGSGTVTIPSGWYNGIAWRTGITESACFLGTMSYANDVSEVVQFDRASKHKVSHASPHSLSFDYVSATDQTVFAYYKGADYLTTITAATSKTITGVVHALATSNLIIQCYEEDTHKYDQVIPDSITINESTYDVTVTFSSAITGYILISRADTDTLINRVYPAGTHELEINDPDASLVFPVVYTVASGIRTVVLPDYVRYEPLTDTIKFGFVLGSQVNFLRFAYMKAQTETNKLIVDTTPLGVYTGNTSSYSNCKLDLWGVQHNYYLSTATYGGQVVEIDKYESPGNERVVVNVGGVFYANYSYDDVYKTSDSSVDLNIPDDVTMFPSSTLQLNLQGTVNGDQYFGPAFQLTGSTHNRTKGYVRSSNTSDGYLPITSIVYNVGNVDVTLDMGVGFSSSGIIIDTNDKLTISQASYEVHNGDFDIVSYSIVGNNLIIKIVNSSVTSSDWDETSGAKGGVFTDEVTVSSHKFIVDDVLSDSLLTSLGISPLIYYTTATKLYISRNTEDYILPTNYTLYVTRSNATLLPLTTSSGTPTYMKVVSGDMILITGLERPIQVSSADNTNKTITLAESVSVTGGLTPTYVTLQGRWLPIEPPYIAYLTTNIDKRTYLNSKEYWNQNIVRSTTVQDNLYMTNYSDMPYKFDGTYLSNIGLSKFPGNLFISTVDIGTGEIQPNPVATEYVYVGNTPAVDGFFLVPDAALIKPGDRVIDLNASPVTTYTVKTVLIWDESSEVSKVYMVESLSTSTSATGGSLRIVKKLRYYFRYKLVDLNNNIIASAATGLNDYIVEVGNSSANVEIKFAPYPLNIGIHDSNKMYIEVFRERDYLAGNFFLVGSIPFTTSNGGSLANYWIFKDNVVEESMSVSDSTSLILTGAELGTAWDKPLFSKYITSINNRLVMANCKDWQTFSFEFKRNNEKITAANIGDIQNSKGISFSFYHGNYYYLNNLTTPTTGFLKGEIVKGQTTGAEAEIIQVCTSGLRVKMIGETLFVAPEDIKGLLSNTKTRVQAAGVDIDPYMYDPTSGYFTNTRQTYQFTNGSGTGITVKTINNITEYNSGKYEITFSAGVLPADITDKWIYIYHSANANRSLKACGWYRVQTRISDTQIRIYDYNTALNNAALTNPPDRAIWIDTTYNIPVLLATDYNYQYLFGTTPPDSSWETLAFARLANAINAVAGLDINVKHKVTNNGTFAIPESWLVAESSSSTNGTCIVQSPTQTTPKTIQLEILNTTSLSQLSPYKLYVNSEDFANHVATILYSKQKLFPSRIIMSYSNFPEIFNGPNGLSGDVKETIDINPSDGDEITGIIPAVSEALFSASLKEGNLIVFKSNAIYVLDIEKSVYTKLDTRGVGCTYPFSIAQTRNGVMFAHTSGLYRLNRDLSISFFHKIERLWNENVDTTNLRMYGHSAAIDRKYKLSVPTGDSPHNNEVYVYNYDREEDRRFNEGSWTRYTQHDVSGWCNLDDNEYFGTVSGQVMRIKDYEDIYDYSDNGVSIPVTILDAPRDFGIAGVRKIVSSVILHLHNKLQDSFTDLEVLAATDLSNTFISLGNMDLSTQSDAKMVSIKFSLPRRKSEYIQMKITGTINNEWFILSGLDFGVAAATEKGIKQQNQFDSNA